jgi:hypothetical protein
MRCGANRTARCSQQIEIGTVSSAAPKESHMKTQIVTSILCLFIVMGCHSDLADRLKSPDPQVRCDAFHHLFGDFSGPGEKPTRAALYGKTTREIYDLLGAPSSLATLDHDGVQWLRISYRFEVCPEGGDHEAWERGWRYSPGIVFRNGISVPPSTVDEELGLYRYSAPPQHLRFKEGGCFP